MTSEQDTAPSILLQTPYRCQDPDAPRFKKNEMRWLGSWVSNHHKRPDTRMPIKLLPFRRWYRQAGLVVASLTLVGTMILVYFAWSKAQNKPPAGPASRPAVTTQPTQGAEITTPARYTTSGLQSRRSSRRMRLAIHFRLSNRSTLATIRNDPS